MLVDNFDEASLNSSYNLDILEAGLNSLDIDFYKSLNISCKYYSESDFMNSLSQDRRLIILNTNIQSINGKFQDLATLLQLLTQAQINIDIITLQETWEIVDANAFFIPGYKFFSATRKLGKRGGVGMYVKDYLKPSPVSEKSVFIDNVLESLIIEVTMPESGRKNFIGSLYRPNTHKELSYNEQMNGFLDAFATFLESFDSKPAYICADSNVNQLLNNAHTTDLNNILMANGFFNTVTKATRFQNDSATAIDHIYTNVIKDSYMTGVITDKLSDHMLTFMVLDDKVKNVKSSKVIKYRSLNNESIERFRVALSDTNWRSVTEVLDTNNSFNVFNDIFMDLFNFHFPEKTKKIKINRDPLNTFMTQGLLKSRKRKLYLAKVARTGDILAKENYKIYRNLYNKLLKLSKKLFFEKRINDCKNNKKALFNTLYEATGMKSNMSDDIEKIEVDSRIIENNEEIASHFNTFFSNIGKSTTSSIPDSEISHKSFLPPPNPNSIFINPIFSSDIEAALKALPNKKSSDINDISIYLLKKVAVEISAPLSHIFNLSIESGTFPERMKTSKTIPVFKNLTTSLVPSSK